MLIITAVRPVNPNRNCAGHAEDVRNQDEFLGVEHPTLVGTGDLPQVGEQVQPRLQERGGRGARGLIGIAREGDGDVGRGGGRRATATSPDEGRANSTVPVGGDESADVFR